MDIDFVPCRKRNYPAHDRLAGAAIRAQETPL